MRIFVSIIVSVILAALRADGQEIVTAKNINEHIKDLRKKNLDIIQRMEEIDKIIAPVEARLAARRYMIKEDEYLFLRKQSECSQLAENFLKSRAVKESDTFEFMADYLDRAYEALRQGHVWAGNENSLVSRDSKLFEFMIEGVTRELEKEPGGDKILHLIAERERLKGNLKDMGPVIDYLIERREWWLIDPEYVKAVRAIDPLATEKNR